jgi:deoxycytidylate deaminase
MIDIATGHSLQGYFRIAEAEAHKSECTRRQYGSIIVYENGWEYATGYNQRVTSCCNGVCARDRFKIKHGERTEVGGEVHSEIAALVNFDKGRLAGAHFLLAGFSGEVQLFGSSTYPCHACAIAIKYVGFRNIYVKISDSVITPVSISQIIADRQVEWEPAE